MEMYTTTRHEATIPVSEYLEQFVDIPTFLSACQKCQNYNHVWSCPPYDFDVESYWKKYRTLYLLATKIVFDEDVREKTYTQEELQELIRTVLKTEKHRLGEELLEKEKQYPGSVSLSAGSCDQCASGCSKEQGKPLPFSGNDALFHRVSRRKCRPDHRKADGTEARMDGRGETAASFCAGERDADGVTVWLGAQACFSATDCIIMHGKAKQHRLTQEGRH